MHVDFDGASQTARRGVVEVGRAPAAVPIVGRRVLVCDCHESKLRVVFDGEDTVRRLGVVLSGVRPEALDEALALYCQRSCSSSRLVVAAYTRSSCCDSTT